MSLHWRILFSFILIVVVTVLLTMGVAFFTVQARFESYIEDETEHQAHEIADVLSYDYTVSGGWDSLVLASSHSAFQSQDTWINDPKIIELIEEGMFFSDMEVEEFAEMDSGEWQSDLSEERRERVVLLNKQGVVLIDNYFQLTVGELAPELGGEFAEVVDLRSNEIVGKVFVDVNRDELSYELYTFLTTTFYSTFVGGLLTVGLTLLLAFWMARRISAPITALTKSAQSMVEQNDSKLVPVNSADELVQMSVSFNQLVSQLQTLRELRKRLLNDVSHEINTPLSVIRLEARGLQDELQTPASAAHHIIQEVDTLKHLVRDLNWIAETDSGELRLTKAPCEVIPVITNEINRWQTVAQDKKVSLSINNIDSLPELPLLNLDKDRITQALGNILNNALQHTNADDDDEVRVAITAGQWLQISITDNGAGISATDLPHLFDRFYRADASRSRHSGGKGLGLAITKAILEAHQGSIVINSDGEGCGTTVTLKLPVTE